jgi:DoxX-like family
MNGLHPSYRHMALWTLQGWLAMFFVAAGYAKLSQPMEMLIILLSWPVHFAPGAVRLLGALEVLLAAAVLSPVISWTFGRPLLVSATMAMLALEAMMFIIHAMSFEWSHALINLALGLMTAIVFIQRSRETAPGRKTI